MANTANDSDLKKPFPDQDEDGNGKGPKKNTSRRLIRVLFLAIAGVFFLVGVLGAFLPVLPATPFLLIASYFLARSSPRLQAALFRSRLFGPILKDWQVQGGVRKDVKIRAIIVVAAAVSLTVVLAEFSFLPTLGVLLLAAVGIAVILRLPTAKRRK